MSAEAAHRLSARHWGIIVVMVVAACAGTVRLLTYDRYLPFVDYSDEAVYVSLADEIRGFSDQTALREKYGLLAPLYVYTNVAVQTVYDVLKTNPWHIPGEYFYVLRLLSVVLGVGTALVIAWIGWLLAGRYAALIGGMIWALAPIVVDLNSLAIPDPMLYFVCAFAVGSGVAAWQRRSLAWLTLSLLMGVAAIYIKLWLVTAVIPFLIVSVALVWQDRQLRSRIFLLYGVAALFALHFLLVLNPFQSTLKISANLQEGAFVTNLFDGNRLLNNLRYLIYPIDGGTSLSLLGFALGATAIVYGWRRGVKTIKGSSWAIVAVYVICTWWLSAGISNVSIDFAGRMRHILPASVAAIALWSACFVVIIRVGSSLLARHLPPRNWWLPTGVSLLMVGLLINFVPGDLELIAHYRLPHTANQILAWFDGSPPQDGIVLIPKGSSYDALWNRLWGAYVGSKPYEWWIMPLDEIPLSTPAEFVERGIRWMVLSEADITKSQSPEDLHAYLDRLLLVKTIPAMPEQVVGDQLYVYRFEVPQHPVAFDFGGQFRLIGYDLAQAVFEPGDTIVFRPYWQRTAQPQQNLSMFVHLYPADSVAKGEPVLEAQWDGELLPNGNRPTTTWNDADEVYFGDAIELPIPQDSAPGDYILAVGLYDYLSQQRLTGGNGETFYRIPITVITATPAP